MNQKVALRMLERLGYRAGLAGNEVEAVQAVQRQPYDVVLMDVQLPELDSRWRARIRSPRQSSRARATSRARFRCHPNP